MVRIPEEGLAHELVGNYQRQSGKEDPREDVGHGLLKGGVLLRSHSHEEEGVGKEEHGGIGHDELRGKLTDFLAGNGGLVCEEADSEASEARFYFFNIAVR